MSGQHLLTLTEFLAIDRPANVMASAIRQMIVRRRSSAVNEYVSAMKNEYLGKVSFTVCEVIVLVIVQSEWWVICIYRLKYIEQLLKVTDTH